MKKLFIFFLFLFTINEVKSSTRCVNGGICMCPNGGYVTNGEYCPVVPSSQQVKEINTYGATAVDSAPSDTRVWRMWYLPPVKNP